MVLSGSWWLLVALVVLVVFAGSRAFLVIFEGTWCFLVVLNDFFGS